jgi:DNA (cytosine-5)-methyltransferase 1
MNIYRIRPKCVPIDQPPSENFGGSPVEATSQKREPLIFCVEGKTVRMNQFTFYEFFAGGGMARAGLGANWTCLFANDFDRKKGLIYNENWKDDVLRVMDVGKIEASLLLGYADLSWASFPCQDLSLAGGGAGLKGERSGTFWPYWSIVKSLVKAERAPRMLVLENVCGTLSSHQGKDFLAICRALTEAGYRYGALVMDAALFVPQSRPRLFFVAARADIEIPPELTGSQLCDTWQNRSLRQAVSKLGARELASWIFWQMPAPAHRNIVLSDLIEDPPTGVPWHSASETASLLGKMSDINLAKVEAAKKSRRRMVGCLYKRTRFAPDGKKIQRAEVRFDDVAGCLRTPAGGSSRQTLLIVERSRVRSRLISARETARLMGLEDDYVLPSNYNEAYHLTGDGVVVPVVRHLAQHLIEPTLSRADGSVKVAA